MRGSKPKNPRTRELQNGNKTSSTSKTSYKPISRPSAPRKGR